MYEETSSLYLESLVDEEVWTVLCEVWGLHAQSHLVLTSNPLWLRRSEQYCVKSEGSMLSPTLYLPRIPCGWGGLNSTVWSLRAPCSVPPCTYLEFLVVEEVWAVLCEVWGFHAQSHLVLTSTPLWLRRSEQYCVKSEGSMLSPTLYLPRIPCGWGGLSSTEWSLRDPCSVPPCTYLESLVVEEVWAVLSEVWGLHAQSHLVLTSNPLWLRRSEQYWVKSEGSMLSPTLYLPRIPCGWGGLSSTEWSLRAPCSVPPCTYLESLVVEEVWAVLCEVWGIHAQSHLVLTSNPLWLRRSEQYWVKSEGSMLSPTLYLPRIPCGWGGLSSTVWSLRDPCSVPPCTTSSSSARSALYSSPRGPSPPKYTMKDVMSQVGRQVSHSPSRDRK